MSLDLLREAISEIIAPERCAAEFYFLLDADGKIEIKRADIDQNALNELSQKFIDSVSNSLLLNDELSLLDISSADERMQAIYRYDLPDVPHQLANLATVLQRDDFMVFNFDSDDLKHLQGILIILGHEEKQLALYKHQYPVALLKKDSSFSLIRMRFGDEHRLVKLDDDILRVNSKFEFMRIGNEYYIVDIKTLERFFGFHEAIRNIAVQGIVNISQSGLVEDVSVLSDRIDDISFSRKLVKTARTSPVLGVIPNAEVITFVSNHPSLRGKFKLSNDGSKLKLDTKVSQNLFLKLLNDDFLQSQLTRRYYESLAKDNLAPE